MKAKEEYILERNQIISNFKIPLRHTPLIRSDISGHKNQIENVYKGMLHEACVIDDCCRRFERMFG
jgi:hypothetical protein